ncbi:MULTISPECIES: hypothetical protein [unclassified Microbacterium]|uniref:hypothetical protein n=1 Tax=unclassified Microbacterium TaxID=2609290 RepID=UPI00301A3195
MSEDARVLCEWIDRTLALPVYQTPGRDTYAEGVVDTLKTVRKLLTKSGDPSPTETPSQLERGSDAPSRNHTDGSN